MCQPPSAAVGLGYRFPLRTLLIFPPDTAAELSQTAQPGAGVTTSSVRLATEQGRSAMCQPQSAAVGLGSTHPATEPRARLDALSSPPGFSRLCRRSCDQDVPRVSPLNPANAFRLIAKPGRSRRCCNELPDPFACSRVARPPPASPEWRPMAVHQHILMVRKNSCAAPLLSA
jgi:hypothetical protein